MFVKKSLKERLENCGVTELKEILRELTDEADCMGVHNHPLWPLYQRRHNHFFHPSYD